MTRQTRRTFLAQAATAAALPLIPHTFAIAGTKGTGRILGANDTIHVGVAGIHGRGLDCHMRENLQIKNVVVSHLIDPDKRLFASRSKMLAERGCPVPKCFQDIRKALEDKEFWTPSRSPRATIGTP